MPIVRCQVCLADNQDEIEAVGAQALAGELTWREGARLAGLKYHQPLKVHMEKHYTSPMDSAVSNAVDAARAEYDMLIAQSILELQAQMEMAPPEVKPLYAVAIHNLAELKNTKPSQQHLIMALRTIQELTGMRQEQRFMLQFAQAMFHELPGQAAKALEAAREVEVIDVEPD